MVHLALFFDIITSDTLWRIWGPVNAPAARNIESFSREFKNYGYECGQYESILDARFRAETMLSAASSWPICQYDLCPSKENFTGFATLASQAFYRCEYVV